jgi:hypothetical protein
MRVSLLARACTVFVTGRNAHRRATRPNPLRRPQRRYRPEPDVSDAYEGISPGWVQLSRDDTTRRGVKGCNITYGTPCLAIPVPDFLRPRHELGMQRAQRLKPSGRDACDLPGNGDRNPVIVTADLPDQLANRWRNRDGQPDQADRASPRRARREPVGNGTTGHQPTREALPIWVHCGSTPRSPAPSRRQSRSERSCAAWTVSSMPRGASHR